MLDTNSQQPCIKVEHSERSECSTTNHSPIVPRIGDDQFSCYDNGQAATGYYPDPADSIDPIPNDQVSIIEAFRRDAQEEAVQWVRSLIQPDLPAPETALERQAYAQAQVRRGAVVLFRLDGLPNGLRLADYARALNLSPSRLSELNRELAKLIPQSAHL